MKTPKPIPPTRDRLQSRLLVALVTPILLWFAASDWCRAMHLLPNATLLSVDPADRYLALIALLISILFALAVWTLRAATPAAAAVGALICLLVTLGTANPSIPHSGLPPLFALFVLTFAATRAGRPRKAALGLAEPRRGRNAAQVTANLGMAGLVVVLCAHAILPVLMRTPPGSHKVLLQLYSDTLKSCLLAVLCEATADTVSSEIGQAFGGTPYLLPRFRPVPAGTDGAISLRGTLAGVLAAALVAGIGAWSLDLAWRGTLIAFLAAIAGLFVDSLLGATLERRGLLGNDLVNFLSTASAALFALVLIATYVAAVARPLFLRYTFQLARAACH